jgi:hypothetical protein
MRKGGVDTLSSFNRVNELASEEGSPFILRLITSSLASLEMRVVIAQFGIMTLNSSMKGRNSRV